MPEEYATSVVLTRRLKVKPESYRWLNAASVEVNQVWNWANAARAKAARPFAGTPKWLSGFDLNNLSAGAAAGFERIGAHTIQCVNGELATKGRQAKRLHRRAANRRRDALHKFSRKMVDRYQNIYVGDVSSLKLVKARMAKSVLDAGWGMLRTQLQYKGQQAGRCVQIVSEVNTTRDCSNCKAATGPSGLRHLVVRQWTCTSCGVQHDRDVNSANNMIPVGSRCGTSVSGNKSNFQAPPSQASRRCEARISAQNIAA